MAADAMEKQLIEKIRKEGRLTVNEAHKAFRLGLLDEGCAHLMIHKFVIGGRPSAAAWAWACRHSQLHRPGGDKVVELSL